MSSSSSTSSGLTNRKSVMGVASSCWCGRNIITYVSQTKENPFRRFYRCEVALQRRMEQHLFKWIDEALLEETRMVEVKHMKLVEEVKQLKKELVEKLELQNEMRLKMEEEMKEKIDEKMKEVIVPIANATMQKCMKKVIITMLVVGTI